MKINKKIIILLGVFLVLLVSITAILTWDKKLNIEDYDKYLLSVIISTKSTEEASHTINVYSDKKNIKIESHYVDKEAFYKDDKLIFIDADERKLLEYKTEYSYSKVYALLKDFKKNKKFEENSYEVTYENDSLNELLSNLYIEDEITGETKASITILEDKIVSFDIGLHGKNFEDIYIELYFDKLDADFKIDDSILNKSDELIIDSTGVHRPSDSIYDYESIEYDQNLLKIVK